MTFRISPGVYVREIDLTTIIPAVSTSIGAFAGYFKWGPVEQTVLVSSEDDMVSRFLKPDDATRVDWLTAASFLAYSKTLRLVRVYDQAALNATSGTAGTLVKNDADYEDGGITVPSSAEWIARFPGAKGNSLLVILIANRDAYDDLVAQSTSIYSSQFQQDLYTTLVGIIGGNFPDTTQYASDRGASNDEFHLFVVDEDGEFSGTPGTVLESFLGVSQASDAKTVDGSPNYYKTVVNASSKYIRWGLHPSALSDAGTAVSSGFNFAPASPITALLSYTLLNGSDGSAVSDADYIDAYHFFENAATVDVSLIFMGARSSVPTLDVIQNIAEVRKDCVVFASPPRAAVVAQSDPTTEVVTYRDAGLVEDPVTTSDTLLGYSSSYAVLDGNWKYMYDRYNDKYSWVPCNGDVAGLCARTDNTNDPWYSPAGFNRGNLKNAIKLAWTPNESQRDQLYAAGVNPVVSFPGRGTVLYGDKTLQSKPSAFDRINVRRLFIVLEKSIAIASDFTLFENNDVFTRASFVALVEPFLREVQGRRGIIDFKVVCDETNNTPEVIDSNSFIGDIYIKPARSINYIRLNFIAVRTGVNFNEIAGGV